MCESGESHEADVGVRTISAPSALSVDTLGKRPPSASATIWLIKVTFSVDIFSGRTMMHW